LKLWAEIDENFQNSNFITDPSTPDFIKINLDPIGNRINFEWSFLVTSCPDTDRIEARFKIILRNQLDVSTLDTRDYMIHSDSHQFHYNGNRIGRPAVTNELCLPKQQRPCFGTEYISFADREVNGIHGDLDEEISEQEPPLLIHNQQLIGSRRNIRPGSSKRSFPINIFYKNISNRMLNLTMNHHESLTMKKPRILEEIPLSIEIKNHPKMILKIGSDRIISDLKHVIGTILARHNYHVMPEDEMRLLFNYKMLNDSMRLFDVEGIEFGRINQIVLVTTLPGRAALVQERVADATLVQRECTRTHDNVRILLRNFQACLSNEEESNAPESRIRFNVPMTKTKSNMTSFDLGSTICQVATEVKQYSLLLSKLSNFLVQDKPIQPGTNRYKQARFQIQVLIKLKTQIKTKILRT